MKTRLIVTVVHTPLAVLNETVFPWPTKYSQWGVCCTECYFTSFKDIHKTDSFRAPTVFLSWRQWLTWPARMVTTPCRARAPWQTSNEQCVMNSLCSHFRFQFSAPSRVFFVSWKWNPGNFAVIRNSRSLDIFPRRFIFVPATAFPSWLFLVLISVRIPKHLSTWCCPELLCCLEINREIILVQMCETPHEGLKMLNVF